MGPAQNWGCRAGFRRPEWQGGHNEIILQVLRGDCLRHRPVVNRGANKPAVRAGPGEGWSDSFNDPDGTRNDIGTRNGKGWERGDMEILQRG